MLEEAIFDAFLFEFFKISWSAAVSAEKVSWKLSGRLWRYVNKFI